ncbi:Bromodomain-containing protein 8 [Smittium culicis]|uniref:Bromodomain-containing protein 8 n=1 Tax=Smittium culicis TaxID=133412 RepID=A0A1R1Y8A7_9FUNG|nr:Bromodomain-containing protein 8 [Smittium culicis]
METPKQNLIEESKPTTSNSNDFEVDPDLSLTVDQNDPDSFILELSRLSKLLVDNLACESRNLEQEINLLKAKFNSLSDTKRISEETLLEILNHLNLTAPRDLFEEKKVDLSQSDELTAAKNTSKLNFDITEKMKMSPELQDCESNEVKNSNPINNNSNTIENSINSAIIESEKKSHLTDPNNVAEILTENFDLKNIYNNPSKVKNIISDNELETDKKQIIDLSAEDSESTKPTIVDDSENYLDKNTIEISSQNSADIPCSDISKRPTILVTGSNSAVSPLPLSPKSPLKKSNSSKPTPKSTPTSEKTTDAIIDDTKLSALNKFKNNSKKSSPSIPTGSSINTPISTTPMALNDSNQSEKQLQMQVLNETYQKRWKKNIANVWMDINAHRLGSVFATAIKDVDAPRYSEAIKFPLDLKLIKNRIRDNEITSTNEFYREILLMFQNALMYNHETSQVYKMTLEIIPDAKSIIEQLAATEFAFALTSNPALDDSAPNTASSAPNSSFTNLLGVQANTFSSASKNKNSPAFTPSSQINEERAHNSSNLDQLKNDKSKKSTDFADSSSLSDIKDLKSEDYSYPKTGLGLGLGLGLESDSDGESLSGASNSDLLTDIDVDYEYGFDSDLFHSPTSSKKKDTLPTDDNEASMMPAKNLLPVSDTQKAKRDLDNDEINEGANFLRKKRIDKSTPSAANKNAVIPSEPSPSPAPTSAQNKKKKKRKGYY